MALNNVCRGCALRIAFGITVLTFLLTTGVLANPVLVDNFSDNAINSSLWTGFARGYGPTYAETNQSLEISVPSNSTNDPLWGAFDAGYRSICSLRGDFDIQVDYKLLTWPDANGVRVGLGAFMADPRVPFPYTFGTVERTSFGTSNDFYGFPREVYITDLSDEWNGNFYTETADQSGKLRLLRSGVNLTGYYYGPNGWVIVHSAPVNTSDANFTIDVWSHDYAFTHQEVKVAFDNFTINQGRLNCLKILYNYSGILPPLKDNAIVKLGATIPVKFQLQDANGNFVTNAVAKIYVAKISNGITGTEIEGNSTSAATTGNMFRYDSTANQYIFNMGTKGLTVGTWQIRIELDDGTSKYAIIRLK